MFVNLQHHNNQTEKTVHGMHGVKDVYLYAHSQTHRFFKFGNLHGKWHKDIFTHVRMFYTFGPWSWSLLYNKTTTHFYYHFLSANMCVCSGTHWFDSKDRHSRPSREPWETLLELLHWQNLALYCRDKTDTDLVTQICTITNKLKQFL